MAVVRPVWARSCFRADEHPDGAATARIGVMGELAGAWGLVATPSVALAPGTSGGRPGRTAWGVACGSGVAVATVAFVLAALCLRSGVAAAQGQPRSPRHAAAPVTPSVDDLLAQARARFVGADLDAAKALFEAVASSAADAIALAEAHRHLAAIALLYGDEPTALRHARWAVAMSASVEAPLGAPPALAARLDAFRSRPTQLTVDVVPLPDGSARQVTARVATRAPELFARIRLDCDGNVEEGLLPAVSLPVSPTQPVRCTASAVGTAGAALLEQRRDLPASTVPEETVPEETDVLAPPPPGRPRAQRRRRWIAAVVAVATVGLAVGLGVGLRPDRTTNRFVGPELE